MIKIKFPNKFYWLIGVLFNINLLNLSVSIPIVNKADAIEIKKIKIKEIKIVKNFFIIYLKILLRQ